MTNKYKEVYDLVYKNSDIYSDKMDEMSGRVRKDPVIFSVINHFRPRKIVDIGCGQGYYVRKFINDFNIDAFGVEISSICCNKYLGDVPHENMGALDFLIKQDISSYDFIFSTDVLEHIERSDVEEILRLSSRISPVALFGLANHSDIIEGIELHIIQEDENWWLDLLANYYDNVKLISTLYGGRFFFILCCNGHVDAFNNFSYQP